METHLEFRSNRFPPYVGESNCVNPGRYGKRLAEFLQQGLKSKGFEPSEPLAEDWGWMILIHNAGFGLRIGCGNYEEYPEDGFLCFIEPHTQTVRKFFRRMDVSPQVRLLKQALDDLLSAENGIRDKRWWTLEQFNHRLRADE